MALSRKKKTPEAAQAMRKQPVQDRAQRTIETIFDATAQIVDEQGEAQLTTNKIAERAGFSIGTLYQYFPTKEAILLAMIHRGRRKVMDEMQAMLVKSVAEGADPERVVRERIRVLIEAFGAGGPFKRSLIRLAWRMDHHENIMQAMREGAEHIAVALAQVESPGLRVPNAAGIFVLTRAVMGTIRSASLEESSLLGTRQFEDELVRLVWGMLRA
ncbi:TetR/AcrR family transcriptional regulator [Herbaspirillum chlorophenolicum]|jgi:AcrR family transcriptional regulator|uniref:TetR/AcrR family transcriptional regulator n=1 Tax=Herbaspirillum chlorophenolicum TaxID=211589 RepID=UPI00067CC2E0|nr:TetR/AcrR family transcriptional regulator [Herbaspirillum chlorophenolicum]